MGKSTNESSWKISKCEIEITKSENVTNIKKGKKSPILEIRNKTEQEETNTMITYG